MIDDRHHDKPATSRREPEGTAMLSAWPEADGWVCNVLVRRGDRLLVLRRSPGGYLGDQWDLPGGKSEPGEEPAVAALRELTEETGLVGELGPEVAHWSNPDTMGGDFRYSSSLSKHSSPATMPTPRTQPTQARPPTQGRQLRHPRSR